MLLHGPRWVLLDDGLGALDEDHRQFLLSIFEDELAATAVVSIGRSPAGRGFYDRTLHLRRLGESATLVPLRLRQRRAEPRAIRALVRPIRASA
jgi:ABC-type uncharacterized transport system fused permease/ATPase subunit